MASHGPLDAARRSCREHELIPLRRWTIAAIFLVGGCFLAAQSPPASNPSPQDLDRLADAQRWSDIVARLQPIVSRSASMDFYLGLALAQLGRLNEAHTVLAAGHRLAPTDPRFPDEL